MMEVLLQVQFRYLETFLESGKTFNVEYLNSKLSKGVTERRQKEIIMMPFYGSSGVFDSG